MTDFRGVEGLKVTDIQYKHAMELHGNTKAEELMNEDDIKLMLEYMKGFEPDRFDVDFELPEDVLIAKFDELDTSENTVADAYDKFAAWLSGLTETPTKPDPGEPEPGDEDIVRPYIPNPDLSDDQKNRMNDFDKMRAEDVHSKLDKDGDYELLLEYVRQREGTSFLVPSDYNEDGTVNEKGKQKEAEMIAKLGELDKADNTIGTVLKDFLGAYNVEEPKGEGVNGLTDGASGVMSTLKKGEAKEVTIGGNKYLITNNGADGNKITYEVKTNDKGTKYIEINANDFRIQDISGKLQDDLIQIVGNNNELDLGLGNDIAHLVGDNNRALMGDGNDKVYIQGEGNFSDMWRGDDQMFNISSNNTTGLGFTGDDNFYSKGDNVLVNGESNTPVGDGLYKDGVTTDHDIENNLNKPGWFPGPDDPVDPPVDPNEKFEKDDDGIIEFNGVKYEVYKKFGKDATDKIVYYKAEDGRTVFESNGWNITVIGAMNDTGDKNYANVVIEGNDNSYFGSNDDDTIEIKGDKNYVHGDTSDTMGSNDKVHITSGAGNYVYGEAGVDEVVTDVEGNFFNKAILDVEKANGKDQDTTVPPTSKWKPVQDPNESQTNQMNSVLEAFGLPKDSVIKGIKQNDNLLGMTIDGKAYVVDTNADGKITNITAKEGSKTTGKVEYNYNNGQLAETKTTDYNSNTVTSVYANGSKQVNVYEDVTVKNPVLISNTLYHENGNQMYSLVVDKKNNKETSTWPDGVKVETTYDDISSTNAKPVKKDEYNAQGQLISSTTYDQKANTATKTNADGTKTVSKYSNVNSENSIQTKEYYDAKGTLLYTETYKGGKVDTSIKEGNLMSVNDFFAKADFNKDNEIKASEILELYNKTTDPELKAVLSVFTDGSGINLAFKIAATNTGSKDYANGNDGITLNTNDINRIAQNGMITSDKLKQLQKEASYASVVGGETGNAWLLNDENIQLTPQNPGYALTDNGKFHMYTMGLLNAAGGNSINKDDLAKFGITSTEDFQNKTLFNQLRQASDLVEVLDTMDGNAATISKGEKWPFNVNFNNENGSITAQNMLDMYNSCVSGDSKNQAWAENMKKMLVSSGIIIVEDNVPKIKPGFSNVTKVNARDLFKLALQVVEYPKEVTA